MTTRTSAARQGGVQMESMEAGNKKLVLEAQEIQNQYGEVLEQWKASGTPYQKALAAVVDEVLQEAEA